MSPPDWVRPVGLDVEVLRGIRGPSTTTAALLTRIEEHLERWQGYVAFSGGKDSLVVLDLARRVEPQVPVVLAPGVKPLNTKRSSSLPLTLCALKAPTTLMTRLPLASKSMASTSSSLLSKPTSEPSK